VTRAVIPWILWREHRAQINHVDVIEACKTSSNPAAQSQAAAGGGGVAQPSSQAAAKKSGAESCTSVLQVPGPGGCLSSSPSSQPPAAPRPRPACPWPSLASADRRAAADRGGPIDRYQWANNSAKPGENPPDRPGSTAQADRGAAGRSSSNMARNPPSYCVIKGLESERNPFVFAPAPHSQFPIRGLAAPPGVWQTHRVASAHGT
jgi:hypothetical protein